MNTLKSMLKKAEYQVKVIRSFLVSDETFHRRRLKKLYQFEPDLKRPLTLNEKICYRMIHDRNPLHTLLADKIKVREYVKNRTHLVMLAPLIAIYDNTRQIDLETLPDRFVLKCNHDSGSTIVCRDKKTFDKEKAFKKLELALSKNMYYSTRERHYKDIDKKLVCEEYLHREKLKDRYSLPEMLRIHCFNGVACFTEADFTDLQGNEFINVYDRGWRLQPFVMEHPNSPGTIAEPALFYNALLAAQALAQGIDYCRVDLMLHNNGLFFSEITLTPCRGKMAITPVKWDYQLGKMWEQDIY
ncbi:ATP-grasp fold amidoligase family protein [Duffyella gerundensis]|uniref:ATP-grasp fold amidoligase family protein n=1 Tax=Duffyella TaxID=3026546 RepID=UPI003F6DCC3B